MILRPVAHDVPRGLTTLSKPIPRGTGEHVARLIRWFETTFDCREGLKRAWTHVPATTAEAQRIEALMKTEGVPGAWTADDLAFHTEFFNRDRGAYYILGFLCEGGPEQEKRLCDAMKKAVAVCLPDLHPTNTELYWRRKIECDYKAAANWDFDTNRPGKTPAMARLSLRIAIPEIDLRKCSAYVADGCPLPEIPA